MAFFAAHIDRLCTQRSWSWTMASPTEKRLLSLETVLSCYGDLMNHCVTHKDWKWTPCVLTIFIGPSAGSAHSQFEREFWPKSERMYVGRGPSVELPGFPHVGDTSYLNSKYQDGQVSAWQFGNIRMKLMIGVRSAICENDRPSHWGVCTQFLWFHPWNLS